MRAADSYLSQHLYASCYIHKKKEDEVKPMSEYAREIYKNNGECYTAQRGLDRQRFNLCIYDERIYITAPSDKQRYICAGNRNAYIRAQVARDARVNTNASEKLAILSLIISNLCNLCRVCTPARAGGWCPC